MKPITKSAPLKEAIIIEAQTLSSDLTTANGYVQVGAGTPVAINGQTYTFEGDGIPANLIMGYKYDPYAAGTAQVSVDDCTGFALLADHEYVAYAEINSTLHSWSVIFTAAPANTAAIVTALVAKINSSPSVGITASASPTADDLKMTADSVDSGDFNQSDSESGSTNITIATPYVESVGAQAEVEGAISQNVFGGAPFNCDRYTIVWMDFVNHNNISGQGAMRIVRSVLYMKDDANAVTLEGAIEDLFDGTTTPYIGDVKKAL